ncbi:MAG TPA: TonB-dependent receptor [Stellaceae bacterium]|nr:TonB-dependent receptor [Stellaceae bacterium]
MPSNPGSVLRGVAASFSLSVFAVLPYPRPALAQTAPVPSAELILPPVEVIAPTPLLGSGIDRAKVPAETDVLTGQDITRGGNANALRALNQTSPGVTLDQASGNPFQPSLFYHGFQASPLQGTPEGLAVYVNGARFNQPFGDTVEWSLIPDLAIDRMNLLGSNPVFGLNALGGALAVEMKNGFTYHGGEIDLSGGSFGKYQGEFQYGLQSGDVAAYVAASGLHEDGWRQTQSSDIANFFGDIGWRGARGELHLDVIAADNRLNNPGTTPVQLLAVNPAAVFTAPNLITNKYARINLTGRGDVSDRTSLQGDVYYDYFRQKVFNGDVPDFAPCNDGSGFLCEAPGVLAIDRNGNPVPDFLHGGPYADLDRQTTNTNGYGASLQVTNRRPLFGRPNQLVAGISFDGGQTLFSSSTGIGGFAPQTQMAFGGTGVVVDQPDGSIVPVRVAISNAYYGGFFTDTYDLTPSLSANVAGRFNLAQIDLHDQLRAALTGNHTYSHFNPAAGLTWKVRPGLSLYASYAEANRAPTPVELSCANPASPCSLANFFSSDPHLKQIVAHTIEAGVRGRLVPFAGATLSPEASFFRTTLSNDIESVFSPIQDRAFFQNVGSTLRQGVDLDLRLQTKRLLVWLAYSYIDAEFQTGFTESSPNNPGANEAGEIQVRPGDRLPNIPAHLFKLGVDYHTTDAWTVGGTAIAASGRFLFGDEANLTPPTPAYFVVNLHTSYQVTKHLQLFGLLENAFDVKYYTFGTFSPTTAVPNVLVPGATNPRSYSPASPIAITVGLRATF